MALGRETTFFSTCRELVRPRTQRKTAYLYFLSLVAKDKGFLIILNTGRKWNSVASVLCPKAKVDLDSLIPLPKTSPGVFQ